MATNKILKDPSHADQRLLAMTDRVLLAQRHLSQRAGFSFRDEQRIIAESAIARRLRGNRSREHATTYERLPVGKTQRGNGNKARPSMDHALQLLKKQCVVFVCIGGLTSESRRVDPRRAVQGIYFKTRILRQYRKSCFQADGLGFKDSILKKRCSCLRDIREGDIRGRKQRQSAYAR